MQGTKPGVGRSKRSRPGRAVYATNNPHCTSATFLRDFGLVELTGAARERYLADRNHGTIADSWRGIFQCALRALRWKSPPPTSTQAFPNHLAVAPTGHATQVHRSGCHCIDLTTACSFAPGSKEIYRAAATELAHPSPCSSWVGRAQHELRGTSACVTVQLTVAALPTEPVANTFGREFFSGSPQEHAVLNRHLLDYFSGRRRAQETTPYNIPASQRHLLQSLGMEEPTPDAPEVPHALHKCIEEGQMRRVARFLPEGAYGLISVKDAKHHLLPRYGSVQNPVHQAQDAHRYPGSAIRAAHFTDHAVYFAHDVSSEVGPHELVERLDKDNPRAHLFVTGMNPAEVLERAGSFEPASHEITYDFGKFNYVFTGSESESYTTDIAVTESWLNHSSLRASSGTVYQIVLLEEKLGHCVWHVFAGDMEEQHTRTFSTGSFVKLPGAITGTFRAEWLPTKLVANILAFVDRTQDLSPRNLAAKVTQLATATTPRLTSRELWIARYIAAERAPSQSWAHVASRSLWRTLYVLSFQWHLLAPQPDIYNFVDERQRFITVKPTMGGGWSWSCKSSWRRDAIPNNPSWLQRVSVFTSAAFTFLAPKILIGEVISMAVMHLPLGSILSHLYAWADLKPLRLMLTAAVVVVTAVLPGHVIRVFTRLASHFWRQLWWPGWLGGLFDRVVTEICGGPGATLCAMLPGRGWAMQAYLWALGTCSVLPGLVPNFILPWVAVHSPLGLVLVAWYLLIVLENSLALVASSSVSTAEDAGPSWCYDLADWCRDFYESDFDGSEPSLLTCLQRLVLRASWHGRRAMSRLGVLVRAYYVKQGCAQGPFVPLPTTAAPVAPVVRDRNVDRTLPPVVLQTARIPAARGAGVVAVDPAGMGFQDWFAEVQRAYLADTAKYPPLTPGQCCFWDCISILGGTPHMWYSWYMAFTGSRLDPADPVVGHVTQTDILRFATSSRIGISMAGVSEFVVASADSWPTVSLVMTYQSTTGLYHVENVGTPSLDPAAGNLAVLFKTISIRWPLWHRALVARFNRTPLDAVPQPTPWLRAVMGNMPMCRTRGEVADAILGSPAASHIDPEAPGEYRLDQLAAYDADGPDLFDFNAPNRVNAIASTAPAGMWAKFTNRDGRLFVAQPGVKVGARRHPDADNREAHNVRPEVPQWTVLRNELAGRLTDYQDVALPAVPLQEEVLSYTADVDRAARLVADLRAHPSALESFADKSVIQGLNSIIDSYKASGATVTTRVRAYVGIWGCGKTTATIAYLKSLTAEARAQVRIVSHTESLRAKSKLALDFPELRGFNFPTTASVLTEPASGSLVFDDAGKFWGGVLDLVLLANPLVTEVVINGDPAQGMSRFPVGGTQSLFDLTPIQCVAASVTKYATVTHRGFRLLSDTLGVHTSNATEGHITHTIGPKRGIPVLTASPRYVGVLSANGREAYTYGDVQGEDFKTDVEIDMTGLEGAVLDRAAYVALTRSSTGCYLHMEAANPSSVIRRPPTGSDIMNALIYAMREGGCSQLTAPSALVKAAFYRHVHESMPSLVWFGRIGASLGAAAYSLVANFAEAATVSECEVDEPAPAEVTPAATPPVDTLVHETHWTAKEDRELAGRGGATDQFKDNAFVNPHVHHRRDTATYFLSVQRRLKTMSAKANARRMARCPRKDMCDEFDRLVPSLPQWSANKHAEYCDRAFREYERTRSETAIRAKLAAHDPMRTGADIVISLKNQVIKKEEKRHKTEAIPGQLIHEYDISQTLSDAPYALYMEDNVISAFPENFLFYRRMNPDQFIRAYQGRWRVDNGVHTSDVTRWDVGCDAGVLNFDVHVMHRAGFPRQYIEAYVERRLTSRSQHGPMATMQNSGDRYTWALNSIRRAVVTSLINGIKPEDTVVINGDDGAVDRFCDVAHFPDSQWEFKSQNGMRGEFSGFELGGVTPQYSAPGLWYRSLILESRDPSAQNRWLNYMGLLAHADLDTPEAHAVASLAHKHMDPDTFAAMLPGPLTSYF